MRYKALILIVVALLAVGCQKGKKTQDTGGLTAEQLYYFAKRELNRGNYESAANLF